MFELYLTFKRVVELLRASTTIPKIKFHGAFEIINFQRRYAQKTLSLYSSEIIPGMSLKLLEDINFDFSKASIKLRSLSFEDGSISISMWYFIKTFFSFWVEWFFILIVTLNPFKKISRDIKLVVVECGENLLSFLKVQEFVFPRNTNFRVISKLDNADENFIKDSNPKMKFLLNNHIQEGHVLLFIKDHFLALYYFLKLIVLKPSCIVLSKDFSRFSAYLHSGNLCAIVRSNSSYTDQEIWFDKRLIRNFKLITLWYSTNTQPTYFIEITNKLKVEGVFELPQYYFYTSDIDLVWNEKHKKWLSQFEGKGEIHAVGPLILKSEKKNFEFASNEKLLSIFDVTPTGKELGKRVYGYCYNYYQTANVEKFLLDIVSAGKVGGANILLKHKREYHPLHDISYINLVKKLFEEHKINIIDHDIDIFEMIKRSSAVICYPLTSPYYIAKMLNKPAAFYDPTGLLDTNYSYYQDLTILKSLQDLEIFIEKNFKEVTSL